MTTPNQPTRESVFEYDGAFHCTVCGNSWGAIKDPTECTCPTPSPTPRTDKVAQHWCPDTSFVKPQWVNVGFARTLERENAALTRRVEELESETAFMKLLQNVVDTSLDNMEGEDLEGFKNWEAVHLAAVKLRTAILKAESKNELPTSQG